MGALAMHFTKWGGKAHWHFRILPLGQDDHGSWFMIPPRTPLRRGSEPAISKVDGFVMLVPPVGEWIAVWNDLDDIAIYVDVTTGTRMEDSGVTSIDLDLDVVRWRDGRVEVLDDEEFQQHQVDLGYPPDVVATAREAAQRLRAAIEAREPPFDDTGEAWLAKASTTWT